MECPRLADPSRVVAAVVHIVENVDEGAECAVRGARGQRDVDQPQQRAAQKLFIRELWSRRGCASRATISSTTTQPVSISAVISSALPTATAAIHPGRLVIATVVATLPVGSAPVRTAAAAGNAAAGRAIILTLIPTSASAGGGGLSLAPAILGEQSGDPGATCGIIPWVGRVTVVVLLRKRSQELRQISRCLQFALFVSLVMSLSCAENYQRVASW